MYGFYRVAAAVPKIKVADVAFNTSNIIEMINEANSNNTAAICFPELSITGYTCADLFFQQTLIEAAECALFEIANKTKNLNIIIIVGTPLYNKNKLYNCAVVIHQGNILGVTPKSFLPNYKEFYEQRWFSVADFNGEIELQNQKYPFGTDLLFCINRKFKFAIEICEDLWHIIPPSSQHSIAGATMIFNPSASNEVVGKADYRKGLILNQSARCMGGYIYASAGCDESTTDLVYGGHSIISENGVLISENERFSRQANILYGDIDCEKLYSLRISENSFKYTKNCEYREIKIDEINILEDIERFIDAHPFVPSAFDSRDKRSEEVFNIQTAGLAKRFEHTGAKKAVIGISGGLDSTLALLVVLKTFKLIGKSTKDILTVTMPGFGTTGRTYNNAVSLCKKMDCDLREIDIKKSCLNHFDDIGHNKDILDVTYENVQARMRTQILMNMANKEQGLVIGTGDLSEIALGWSTYNGDHMSMYAVNSSVPKTLIRYIIQWYAEKEILLKDTLLDIIDTPVSPELLPTDSKGEIAQKTESILGPYELHDFFLYHTVKYGAKPEKIKYLAKYAFGEKYTNDYINKIFTIFIKRFFSQQFKRSCIPDGPKVGSISLSPRGDWRMPSDASSNIW